ncbi:MAG: serine hydrolase domain-containing protein [Pseudomonadota bacterium]
MVPVPIKLAALGLLLALPAAAQTAPTIDAQARRVLADTRANGLAIALIDQGRVVHVAAFGKRNVKNEPLKTDTVMYGASLTKTVFAWLVLRLVDQGKLDLDRPLAAYLPKPLPEYPAYAALAGDTRWQIITARHALTHSTGFANFFFLEPDKKPRVHFAPGSRYAYSGEGLHLLQFVLENGLKLDVGALAAAEFARLGMTRTALQWREDFAANLADGWNDKGEPQEHDQRSSVRVAGSMDTTIADMAKFAAALVTGDGLSAGARAELSGAQLAITTAHQFPTLAPELPPEDRREINAGLGVVTFEGPQGPGFYKGGHDGQTANTLVCLKSAQRCVVILANDVRAEAGFAALVTAVLGATGVPYAWEYGLGAGKSEP